MATPPGSPSPYGDGYDQRSQGGQTPISGAGAPFPNRFNFPSSPSEQATGQWQQGQQGPGWPGPNGPHHPGPPQQPHHPGAPQQPYPQGPPAPYEEGPPPRIEPTPPPAPQPGAEQGKRRTAQQRLVRPYAMTGGRTRPRYQLAIEALVHTTAATAQLQGQLPEHQRICRLCYEIKSVAEISALLSIPLGVARILVADLAEAGLVAIHQPGGDGTNVDGQPDVTLLERVLSGLRKL